MSHLSLNLSTRSMLAILCGLCIASLAYVCIFETIASIAVKPIPYTPHKELANCNHSILRSFYKTYHAFPESGEWLSDQKNKTNESFEPSICKFKNCDVFNMFRMKGITYGLFVGDSQGRYSFSAVRKYISSLYHVSCTPIITSDRGEFFLRDGVKLLNAEGKKGGFRPQCVVETFLCKQLEHNFTVKMHFIRIGSWSEAVIVSGYPNMPTFKCLFVEFIFKHYLYNSYPNLVVVFSLFNHLKSQINITESDFVDHIMPFRHLVQSTLPRTTWVQWLTNPLEFEKARKGASLKYKGRTYNGHLAGEVMVLFSRWMFKALADILVTPDSNHLGFFNVANMTSSMAKRSGDGVHLNRMWYEKWMAYVLETMCQGL